VQSRVRVVESFFVFFFVLAQQIYAAIYAVIVLGTGCHVVVLVTVLVVLFLLVLVHVHVLALVM
jgi:hypothetical protein